jgi:uncharacterized protein (TIGR02246 family)
MKKWTRCCLAGGVVAAVAIGIVLAGDERTPKTSEPARDADAAGVRATAGDFAAAFNKGNAKAVAAQWTENGECIDADGTLVQGRAAIERAFAEFFKDRPQARIEVLVGSVRFPAPDVAVEEGVLRQTNSAKDLPSTTLYSVTHVRSGGRWQAAVSREWGAGQDRLEDVEWLVGEWKAAAKDQEVTLTFQRDGQKPYLMGRFTKRAAGKEIEAGTMRIGLDPQTGQLRSWHFDEGGGHGQALWVRDGGRWVLDAVGVLGDGAETASVNLLGRVGPDTITWQSIDRVVNDHALPDTAPLRLDRTSSAK